MDWIFFGPAKLVALSPWGVVGFASLLIGLQFFIEWRRDRATVFGVAIFRSAGVFAGLLWLIFLGYELQMGAAFAASTPGATPLRWDLLVLTPILIGTSTLAVWSMWRQLRR